MISSSTYSPVDRVVEGRGKIGGATVGEASSCSLALKSPGNPAIENGRLVTGAGTKVGGTATLDRAINKTKLITVDSHVYNSYVFSLNELTSVLGKKEYGLLVKDDCYCE